MEKNLNRFAIAYNAQISNSMKIGEEVARFLKSEGATVVAANTIYDEGLRKYVSAHEIDALIVLGGDGTMLRASHLCASSSVPIVGINLGTMGFLIEVQPDEWKKYLPSLLTGKYRIENDHAGQV